MLPNSFFLLKKHLACSIHLEAPSRRGKMEFPDPSGPLNTYVWLLSSDGEIQQPAVLSTEVTVIGRQSRRDRVPICTSAC